MKAMKESNPTQAPHKRFPPKIVWPSDGKEMMLVEAGIFVMGDDQGHWPDQKPAHGVYVAAFYMDRYPITNAEYQRFINAVGYSPLVHMPDGRVPPGKEDHPVVNVSWNDAWAYAHWADKRLPSEAEWEKAASWDPVQRVKTNYPWGNVWNASCCNIADKDGQGDTSPVAACSPGGDSPYSIADMLGNVWEWCSSAALPYPYQTDDGREDLSADSWRVLRGAGWDTTLQRDICCTFRKFFPPGFYLPSSGCRCVVSANQALVVATDVRL
jgi:formylglycine-generating enzyme required for sulfatase activity